MYLYNLLEGFFALAVRNLVGDMGLQVVFEHDGFKSAQSIFNGLGLGDDVDAVLLALYHAREASNLAFYAVQPCPQGLLRFYIHIHSIP